MNVLTEEWIANAEGDYEARPIQRSVGASRLAVTRVLMRIGLVGWGRDGKRRMTQRVRDCPTACVGVLGMLQMR